MRDDRATARLIRDHVPMARRIARSMRRFARASEREDLEASAFMGLVEAANRYDAERKEPFEAFAFARIRGAVLDTMRTGDLLPRRKRALANRVARATAALERRLGRSPDDTEVAQELEVSVEEYQEEIRSLPVVRLVELGPDVVTCDPEIDRAVDRRRMIERVRSALDSVPDRERQILSLYYREDLTFLEIGRVLGISEARVFQLHKRAVARIRSAIGSA
jgi:RNA polymerase sigma factor for flagellar operon FliA